MTNASTLLSQDCLSSRTHAADAGTLGSSAFGWLRQSYATYRQRRHLVALDTDALKDVGLTQAQALDEASRPFWDLPRTKR